MEPLTKISTLQTPNVLSAQNTLSVTPGEAQNKFSTSLKNAIETLNSAQIESDRKTEALAKGEITDLHDVMITSQKASITLQTAIEVQRKVIDAYTEVMRMQV
ncbi:flagellar hook-basal body complex protein FliE [Radiobacillus kanasensis]|uniref:flagellar hook-basal body complex protein FliE n=1 Tax=Radiobacillus kanasensis TaxID=2844358 RepID=UPI001E5992B2|nr:flagellar hook-basal body complex protein FliE [Radiobacillus kanasensis]UFU01021.1 flagellar hook-basal body complex protein FliE [Radiobacillus kanasensis]